MKPKLTSVLPALLLFAASCSDAGQEATPPGVAGTGSGGMAGAASSASGGPSVAGSTTVAGNGSGGSGSSGSSGSSSAGVSGSSGSHSGGAGGQAGNGGGGGLPASDGKGLYEANCMACHGEQGVGGPLAPEIVHPVRDYSTWVVRNGRAQTTFPMPMAKWGADKLSDAQLMLVYDYLDQPPQPTSGAALYADYCANCHGADGKGGPTMRNVTNEVAKVLTQTRSGKNVGKFEMRRDYMPAFPTTDISDAELMLIRDYVDSL